MLRQEQRRLSIEAAERALKARKQEVRSMQTSNVKRKPISELARYVAEPISKISRVNEGEAFLCRHYNLKKQIVALIDHILVRYRPPLFLYRSVLTVERVARIFGKPALKAEREEHAERQYAEWFLTIASGRSLAKSVDTGMTKRECHWFLQAPESNTIPENIRWAKMRAAEVSDVCSERILSRFLPETWEQLGEREADLYRALTGFSDDGKGSDSWDVIDFLVAVIEIPSFSFKGRTAGSLRKLCDEWHRTGFSGRIAKYMSWSRTFQPWHMATSKHDIRVRELTTNRELAAEGRKLQHCVYTYASYCSRGESAILSFRWYRKGANHPDDEVNRITAEVDKRTREIWQIRGHKNRRPTAEELAVVREWAASFGVLISTDAA